MKKKILNKVLNIVVTLMAAIALMLGNVTSVAAYTAAPGTYPFVFDDLHMRIWHGSNVYNSYASPDESNIYRFGSGVNTVFDHVDAIQFGDQSNELFFPYEPDLFDYYFVGTVAFQFNDLTNYHFDNGGAYFSNLDKNGGVEYDWLTGFQFVDFVNQDLAGFSFYGKIPDTLHSTAFPYFCIEDPENDGVLSSDVYFTASILQVEKSSSETSLLSSILQTLTQINQNLITSNSLQQSTIDAINQNTTNISNWFTTLITTLQGWFNTRTEDLRTWFYMLEERMSAGFTALYHQMTKEQDEKLNGYEDTTQSDAADNFNTESDKLTQLEDQLNDQSHGFVSDYTTTGFNTGVLTTLSSSLIFVTTWFANFWNMGGIFTAGLNLCFSLSIVFFILRLRR